MLIGKDKNLIMKELLLKYNKPGPRYTSYPPANFFKDGFTEEDYKSEIIKSNEEKPEKISLYFHVPFCPQICHFCGCNTDELKKKSLVKLYFDAMEKELENVAGLLSKDRTVSQIHWGGGTPNSVAISFIEGIMTKIYKLFQVDENAEIAMECSPAYLSKKYLSNLKNLGFNRISIGVQDFDFKVLDVVNRAHPKYPIAEIVKDAREVGIEGINLDLIYGLPLQTTESFLDSIKKALEIRPDRLVTFSYAHIPWVKDKQKCLEEYGLPSPDDKLNMLISAYNTMLENGYEAIGMDHYALPSDILVKSKSINMLHRNFQGYCTKETTGQVYAFGSTGITQLSSSYFQSTKNTSEYIRMIKEKGFAIERAYVLSKEEKIIRLVLEEIMCNGLLNFDDIAKKMDSTKDEVKQIVKFNISKLQEFVDDNLLSYENDEIKVSDQGMFVVRNIAMAFDPFLAENINMYSKTI